MYISERVDRTRLFNTLHLCSSFEFRVEIIHTTVLYQYINTSTVQYRTYISVHPFMTSLHDFMTS
jgi:hypothetical protein